MWSITDQVAGKAGVWATPALGDGVVYFATNGGRLLAVDMETGAVVWSKNLGSQTWQSPVVVDDTLIEGDCEGNLHAYDVSAIPRVDPPLKWTVKLDGCIEATPAVWKGRIYVAARGGKFYALGDADRRPDARAPRPAPAPVIVGRGRDQATGRLTDGRWRRARPRGGRRTRSGTWCG